MSIGSPLFRIFFPNDGSDIKPIRYISTLWAIGWATIFTLNLSGYFWVGVFVAGAIIVLLQNYARQQLDCDINWTFGSYIGWIVASIGFPLIVNVSTQIVIVTNPIWFWGSLLILSLSFGLVSAVVSVGSDVIALQYLPRFTDPTHLIDTRISPSRSMIRLLIGSRTFGWGSGVVIVFVSAVLVKGRLIALYPITHSTAFGSSVMDFVTSLIAGLIGGLLAGCIVAWSELRGKVQIRLHKS